MANPLDGIRDHLRRCLDWEEAHVGFDKAVEGIPSERRGSRPPGFEHSPWQLLEHIRIAQDDILEFCTNPAYRHTREWPDDYWPAAPAPADDAAWTAAIAAYRRDREALKDLVARTEDLTAPVPTGKAGQTYLRAVLLTADHTAYHVGQLVAVRRALQIWP
jgi:uncharacterized damage-inducible protein DinB